MVEAATKPKTNRRVRYTQMVIRQSFLELLETRPIEKITVTDICAKADINRGTFYAHYADPYDLLARIEQELLDKIARSLTGVSVATSRAVIRELLTVIREDPGLCRSLFSEFGDKAFLKKILDLGRDKTMEYWRAGAKDVPLAKLEWVYAFSAYGSMAVIQQWLQSGMRESPDELAQFMDQLTRHGLQAVIAKRQ